MRRHGINKLILVLTFALIIMGLIIIYAIGPLRVNFMNSAYGYDYDTNYFFTHQIWNVVAAVVAFVVAFFLPYRWLRKYAKVILIAGLVLCAGLQLFAWLHIPLAKCELGACRWYNLGVTSFQPAELLKLGLVLYLAQLVALRREEGKLDTLDFWRPFALYAGLSLFFVVVLQKDLGTGIVMIAIILTILLMGGVSWKRMAMVIGAIAVAGVLAIVSSPHRMERLMTYGQEGSSDSYHIDNAMLAIGTGGFFGVGPGNSVQATGYLPESINDSIFAVMGETVGFVGLMAVVACYTILLAQLLKVSDHLADLEQSLVVVGVFAWVMAHVIVNIGAMTGLIPLTGITLPLLSYGGTSMMFISFALGASLQLSCYTSREVRKNEDTNSRRGIRGAHYTGGSRRA